jgi:hypothetical protein
MARVVAKVPNPNAGHTHYTTASKLVTLECVRIAEPKIFAWISRVKENLRCIVHYQGKSSWSRIRNWLARLAVAKGIAGYQKSWATTLSQCMPVYTTEPKWTMSQQSFSPKRRPGKRSQNSRFATESATGRKLIDNKRMYNQD